MNCTLLIRMNDIIIIIVVTLTFVRCHCVMKKHKKDIQSVHQHKIRTGISKQWNQCFGTLQRTHHKRSLEYDSHIFSSFRHLSDRSSIKKMLSTWIAKIYHCAVVPHSVLCNQWKTRLNTRYIQNFIYIYSMILGVYWTYRWRDSVSYEEQWLRSSYLRRFSSERIPRVLVTWRCFSWQPIMKAGLGLGTLIRLPTTLFYPHITDVHFLLVEGYFQRLLKKALKGNHEDRWSWKMREFTGL